MEIADIGRALGLENLGPEDIDRIKFQLQQLNDTIRGGLRSANFKEYRNTYVINAQDSLDSDYPMYVHFNIISEMTKIVSIKLSFWLLNFRAYSKGAKSGGGSTSGSGGGQTSSSGGGQTTSSGGSSTPTSSSGGGQTSSSGGGSTPTTSSKTTPSGGGATSGSSNVYTSNEMYSGYTDATKTVKPAYASGNFNLYGGADKDAAGVSKNIRMISHRHWQGDHTHTTPDHTHPAHTHTVTIANHTHTVANHTHTVTIANHTHTVANHTHTVANHTHTTPDHTHDIVYGIYEEETSPTIVPSISRDNGLTYSLPIGSYTKNQETLDITRFIDTAGSKMIKLTSTTRARLSVQIEIKLDIKAR